MIFVTVGTTSFDQLIKMVDGYFDEDKNTDDIVFQIGSGSYQPKHGEFFTFRPSIDELINSADIVITHGGSTVLSLLLLKKKFVAVANTDLADDHQTKFLKKINQVIPILWTNNLEDLPGLINECIEGNIESVDSKNFKSLMQDIMKYIL